MLFRLTLAWLIVVGIAIAAISLRAETEEGRDDQIVASFERELNRAPAPRKEVTRDAIEEDELYVRINKPLQSDDEDHESQEQGAEQ